MSSQASPYPGLPDQVLAVINDAIVTEFATMSAKGVPIDTPAFSFRSADGHSVDVATGLAYPAKAERARRNPKVGLLIEGPPGQPVVSIAALAAVRDANLQANVDRYLGETIAYLNTYSGGNPWPVVREAIWYWARLLIFCTPKRILWWADADSTDQAPQRWNAPDDFIFPASDPAPKTPPSPAPAWPIPHWPDRAKEVLAQGLIGHLTLVDDQAYPLPFRAREAQVREDGFDLDVPAGAPWLIRGSASLCFAGLATFIGNVEPADGKVRFKVERMLPDLPTVQDNSEIWKPKAATLEVFMDRLTHELSRRGQQIPTIPQQQPAPSDGSLRRAAIIEGFSQGLAAPEQQ